MPRVHRRLHNSTVSRLKSFLFFTDTFQNTFRSGWKTIRSGWNAGINTVTSSSTSFPINTVKMTNENVTISLKNPGTGTGAALWVSDDGNWWSVVSKQEQCSGCGSCSSVSVYNPCGATNPCIATGGTTNPCVATGGNVNPCVATGGGTNPCVATGGYTNPCIATGGGTNPCVATGGYTNPCIATGGGTNPCVATGGYTNPSTFNPCGTTNPYVCNPIYYSTTPGFYTCSMYNPSGFCKFGFYTPASTSGPFGGNCSGGNCASTFTAGTYVPVNPCGSGGNPIPFNPCGSGGTYVPINPCGAGNNPIPVNPCGSGGTYVPINPCGSGGNPIPVNPCGSGGTTNPIDPCGSGGTTNPINPCGSGGNCIGTGGECLSYFNTYPRHIRIYRYLSNAITQMASITLDSLTTFPVLRGLKVSVSNASKQNSTATITAKAYSDTAMVTQIGNDLVYSATGVNIITNYGIIASDSAYNQVLTIEEVDIR